MPDQVQLTPSEKAALIAALERTLLVAAKARSVDHGLRFQILALRDAPDSALRELRELRIPVETGHSFHAMPDTVPPQTGQHSGASRTPFRREAGQIRPL